MVDIVLGIQGILASGDKQPTVDYIAKQIKIGEAYGGVTPQGKLRIVSGL